MSSALRSSVVSRRGAPPGATMAAGCGSKVTTVSAPRMTSRWPRWTPSKVPTAIRRGRGSTSESGVTFIRGTLRRASAGRPRGAPRWPPGRRRRPARTCSTSGSASRVDRLPVTGAPRGVGVDLDARQEGERLLERQHALGIGVLDGEGPDPRAPQLLAVAVAQLGDERAHVGPGRALDEELRRDPRGATAARSGRRRPRARAPRRPRRRARARRPCAPARGRPSRSAGAGRCARWAAPRRAAGCARCA